MKSNFVVTLLLADTSAVRIQEIDGKYPTQVWVPGPKLTPYDPDQQAAEQAQKDGFNFRAKRTVVDQIDLQTTSNMGSEPNPNVPTREWIPGPRDTGSYDPDHMAAVARQKEQHQYFAWPSVFSRTLAQNDPDTTTREWVDGPGFPNDPNQRAAEASYKDQFDHFAWPSIHPRYLAQTYQFEPTRPWIDGPGFANDPDQQAAEARNKDQFERFNVGSITAQKYEQQHGGSKVPSRFAQVDPNAPTREWIDGPGFPNDPEQQAAEARNKDQFERFAVPSITAQRQRQAPSTYAQADPNSPTREWIDGPGFPNDPEQQAAEARYKEQFEKFAVPSVHPRYHKNNGPLNYNPNQMAVQHWNKEAQSFQVPSVNQYAQAY